MSKNVGTLITAPVRPNDSLDLIASALAYEIQGGLHSVENITQRNQIYTVRREWGMIVSVYNDSADTGFYTLTRGLSSQDLSDNGNWEKLDFGLGSAYWLDPVVKFTLGPGDITSPSDGDRFIIGTPSSGVFATQSGRIAIYNSPNYSYQTPNNGSVVLNFDTKKLYFYSGTWPSGAWEQLSGGATAVSTNYIFQDSSTIDFVTSSSGADVIVTANIFTSSITPDLLNIGTYAGPTSGFVLSVDESGNFNWVSQPSSGFTLSVIDFNTGITYSGIQNIIFRGGVVNVPNGTGSAVTVLGSAPTVTVWIPAPAYVDYFSPQIFNSTQDRFIANPVADYYSVGGWSVSSDFIGDTTRPTTNSYNSIVGFSSSEFSCFSTGTTMSFIIYDGTGSVISQIQNFILNSTGSTSSFGITISVSDFSADKDRYKAIVSGTLHLPSLLPNGGRFRFSVAHFNSEGPGNTASGVYEYYSDDIFFDNDGTTSSISVSGPIDFDELTSQVVYYSGVAYYRSGQTFSLTASSIDLLNDESFPNSVQTRFTLTNMAVTGNYDGFADGSKGYGSQITGWNIDYNNIGCTFTRLVNVNQSGQYIPGFSTNNTISSTPTSYISLSTYDWGLVGTTQSVRKRMLFDTLIPSSATYNNNPIESEAERLSVSGVTASGTASFDSLQSLDTFYTDELQYIWGRVIYPQSDFTQFYPSLNFTASVDYSGLTGSIKTFNIFTDLNTVQFTSYTFSGYRWFVTSYTKGGPSFGNGVFTINSNFLESYLDYDFNLLTSGTGDLVILAGIDNTGSNATPDSFMFLSADPTQYPGRVEGTTINLTLTPENNKKIKFDKGASTATTSKIWLFIGYKNSANGQNLRLTNISLS